MKKLFSWVEIPATDFKRAIKFYRTIFKTEFKVVDCGHEKMAFFPGDEGAISYAPNFFKPSKDGLLVSFNVSDNIENTLERVKKNGGEIVTEKTKIEAEGRGYFSVIIDSEGNKVGLYGDE